MQRALILRAANAEPILALLVLLAGFGAVRKTMAAAPEGGYDYDLVVIGGGSGGLAASKVIFSAMRWFVYGAFSKLFL